MKNLFFALGAAAVLGLAGCNSNSDAAADPNVLVSNDFDTLVGWLPDPQNATLTNEKAHSGHYSLKVDAGHDYSMGYREPLGRLTSTRLKRIVVSAWTLVPTADAHASLVVAVTNPANPNEKPLLWEGIEIGKGAKLGEWTELKKEVILPENVLPTNTLGLYLWRTGGDKPVYLDDLKVSMVP